MAKLSYIDYKDVQGELQDLRITDFNVALIDYYTSHNPISVGTYSVTYALSSLSINSDQTLSYAEIRIPDSAYINNTYIGSNTQPIYIGDNGIPTPIAYSLGYLADNDIKEDAKYSDTINYINPVIDGSGNIVTDLTVDPWTYIMTISKADVGGVTSSEYIIHDPETDPKIIVINNSAAHTIDRYIINSATSINIVASESEKISGCKHKMLFTNTGSSDCKISIPTTTVSPVYVFTCEAGKSFMLSFIYKNSNYVVIQSDIMPTPAPSSDIVYKPLNNIHMTDNSVSYEVNLSDSHTYQYAGLTSVNSVTLSIPSGVKYPGFEHYVLLMNNTSGICAVTPNASFISDKSVYSIPANGFIEFSVHYNGTDVILEHIIDGISAQLGTLTDEIWYTSTDGNIVTPFSVTGFDANIVSNTYVNGKGIIKFDAPLTTAGSSTAADAPFRDRATLSSVSFPQGVTIIGINAVRQCTALTSVTIPDSVTTIGNQAFYNCRGLLSINIPKSVTSIGASVFTGCVNVTSITVDPNNTVYDSRNNCNALIKTVTAKNIQLIKGCKNTVIPDGVYQISDSAFAGCTGLTSITIPNSVTLFANYAFSGSGLTSVIIPNSVTKIQQGAFKDCTSLTSVTVEATTPPTLSNSNAFLNTNNCPIYVPAQSVDTYKAATNWSEYADRIQAIPTE